MPCDAETLIEKDADIWRILGIESGGDLYPDPIMWAAYSRRAVAMLSSCGYNRRRKVPKPVWEEVENQNFHSLVQVIANEGLGVGLGRMQMPSARERLGMRVKLTIR